MTAVHLGLRASIDGNTFGFGLDTDAVYGGTGWRRPRPRSS